MQRQLREVLTRFGIPESAMGRLSVLPTEDVVFIGTKEAIEFDACRPMRRGIRLCRVFPHSLKPTTWAMQVLGRHATKNVIDLDGVQAASIINGGQFELEANAEDGFVLLRCRGFVVGVGLYKRPLLKSQIPRHRPVQD
jgi:NOL1/NOP2/fmu family ribosome biogenesis protein